MKHLFSLLLTLLCCTAGAQSVWYDPMQAEYDVVQNQAFTSEIKGYARLPKRAEGVVRKDVWNLAQHSAGLMISFYTNSTNIEVRYATVSRSYAMPHMPSTGVSGVDLYRIEGDGTAAYCAGRYSFGDEVTYKYKGLPAAPEQGCEYRLYLPLYNGVKSMQIGVDEGSLFRFEPTAQECPMVLYGTSIAQGGCVSRPAMAWGTILHRSMGLPLVNLGFSGNGRLENEVIDFINEIEACIYILDCLPNILEYDPAEVERLTIEAVRQIRSKHDAPILLVEHVGYTTGNTNPKNRDFVIAANNASQRAYDKLTQEGVQNIYYITREQMAIGQEMAVDGNHLTDWGMWQQAKAVEALVREALHMPAGE